MGSHSTTLLTVLFFFLYVASLTEGTWIKHQHRNRRVERQAEYTTTKSYQTTTTPRTTTIYWWATQRTTTPDWWSGDDEDTFPVASTIVPLFIVIVGIVSVVVCCVVHRRRIRMSGNNRGRSMTSGIPLTVPPPQNTGASLPPGSYPIQQAYSVPTAAPYYPQCISNSQPFHAGSFDHCMQPPSYDEATWASSRPQTVPINPPPAYIQTTSTVTTGVPGTEPSAPRLSTIAGSGPVAGSQANDVPTVNAKPGIDSAVSSGQSGAEESSGDPGKAGTD